MTCFREAPEWNVLCGEDQPASGAGARSAGVRRMSGRRVPGSWKQSLRVRAFLACGVAAAGVCTEGRSAPAGATAPRKVVVDSVEDVQPPPPGTTTLRAALETVRSGGKITFAPALNGGIIRLRIVGATNSVLKGEVYSMGLFDGYQERDYGRSALYVRKNVNIDASSLPDGITIQWDGGESESARVLAVYGNLTMSNVSVISGYALSEPIQGGTQPYTLGRGGGIAVWGTAKLNRCTLSGNRAEGDTNASRDRGAFGGGIYGNRLLLNDCIISGNSARGYGAAGGGVYSVGGHGMRGRGSALNRCAITGNRVTAQHAYGGGVFSEGGGPGSANTLALTNCTIARNAVEDNPGIPEPSGSQYYYRGGGVYMTNGSLAVASCTIVENAVTGHPAVFNGKPNMGGGAVAATIGSAHVVENMEIWHSIIAGNSVNGGAGDLYTGSLMHFFSYGYNLIGKIDFSQILVPVPPWWSLSRRHYPKEGDRDGVELPQVLSLDAAVHHASIRSVGVDEGAYAVLWYPPAGEALDRIPEGAYRTSATFAQYQMLHPVTDVFLNLVLETLRTDYASILGSDFGSGFGDLTGVTFVPVARTWTSEPGNAEWIRFWRGLDAEIGDRLGAVRLGDDFWGRIEVSPGDTGILMTTMAVSRRTRLVDTDQLRHRRPASGEGDIGSIERQAGAH